MSANHYRLPPRYKSNLEPPPFDASKVRTVRPDWNVTAAAIAAGSAVRLPTKVPTPGGMRCGGPEGGHGDGLLFKLGREPMLGPSLYLGQ